MPTCQCDRLADKIRIQCLVAQFEALMLARGLPISIQRKQQLLDTSRLADIKLSKFVDLSATAEYAESQILYTFIKTYIKSHPNFQRTGPDFGDIKVKTSFFEAT